MARLFLIFTTICVFAASPLSFAEEAIGAPWSMFGGNPARTGIHTGPVTTTDGTVKWEIPMEINHSSSPAVGSDGTIYCGANELCGLVAFNPDGIEKWRFPVEGWLVSSPAISPDGTIIFGSKDSNIYALNPDGSTQWDVELKNGLLWTAAIGADGTIYIGGYGYFFALTPKGEIKWSYACQEIRSNAVIGTDGTIYVAGYERSSEFAEYMLAFRPNGELLWKTGIKKGYSNYDCFGSKCSMFIFSSPAIGPDGTVYHITEYEGFYAFNAKSSIPVLVANTPTLPSTLTSRPNPFNPATTITFTLPEPGMVSLAVYNLAGQRVRTLVAGHMFAGSQHVVWDGKDDNGDPVSSGVYLSRLSSGGRIATGRMLLVK